MKTETEKKTILSAGRASGMGMVVVRDIANVTWRMLTPTLAGIALGYWLGSLVGQTTAGFLTGAVIGFAVGMYFALRLLNEVKEHQS